MFWKSSRKDIEEKQTAATVGFWCIPTGQYVQSFLKLPIKERYIVDGQVTVKSTSEVGAAWAIVANAHFLSQYFDWLPNLFSEILQTYGEPFQPSKVNTACCEEALRAVIGAAIGNGLTYVLAEGTKATIFGNFQPYVRALINELEGTVIQRPQNVRVGIIRSVTTASPDARTSNVEIPIDQLLQVDDPT